MLAAYTSPIWENLHISHFHCESDHNTLYELCRWNQPAVPVTIYRAKERFVSWRQSFMTWSQGSPSALKLALNSAPWRHNILFNPLKYSLWVNIKGWWTWEPVPSDEVIAIALESSGTCCCWNFWEPEWPHSQWGQGSHFLCYCEAPGVFVISSYQLIYMTLPFVSLFRNLSTLFICTHESFYLNGKQWAKIEIKIPSLDYIALFFHMVFQPRVQIGCCKFPSQVRESGLERG